MIAPPDLAPGTASAHISVCICTYKRPQLLARLLAQVGAQETDNLFTHSIVVVDNDCLRSAEATVSAFREHSSVPVAYFVEPHQNIALARNKAVQESTGDFLAFIDDDEIPPQRWLATLLGACRAHGVDGVLGPVAPCFETEPPRWVLAGHLCERPTYKTGTVIDWPQGRTGNVLLKRAVFVGLEEPFRPQFLTGEDQDFFRRMIETGHRFVWCNEALAREVTPATRWSLRFLLRRALLRGQVSIRHPGGPTRTARSIVAVPLYCAALPFMFLIGYHWFVKYLVKLCDHAGRLLALLGVYLVHDNYVTK